MQKKFPATRITSTSAPRKCTQVSTVARFFGEMRRPEETVQNHHQTDQQSGICKNVREWRHFKNRPSTGTSKRSNGGASHEIVFESVRSRRIG